MSGCGVKNWGQPIRHIENIYSKNKFFLNMVLFTLLLLIVAIDFIGVNYTFTLNKNKIAHENGFAFIYIIENPTFPTNILLFIKPRHDHPPLVLKENGITLRQKDIPHDFIRQAGEGRYSHWRRALYFSASDNTDPRISPHTYQAVAPLSIRPWFYFFTLLVASPICLSLIISSLRHNEQLKIPSLIRPVSPLQRSRLRFKRLFHNMDGRIRITLRALRNIANPIDRCVAGFALLFFGLPLVLASVCALFYLIVTTLAYYQGYALASAAIFRLFPILEGIISSLFPDIFHWLLLYAILMALWMWIGMQKESPFHSSVPLVTLFTGSWLRFWGLPCLTACFLLILGVQLNGTPLGVNVSFLTVSGLLPFSDASDYLYDARMLELTGTWSYLGTQRPLAAGLRNFLLAMGGTFQNFQILQTLFAAFSLWIAARAVGYWRGTPAALALCALCGFFALSVLPTPMAEANGMSAALLTLPLFIFALRTGSPTLAACAIGGTVLALMLRMGAFFTVPALFIWMCLFLRKCLRACIAALGMSLLLVSLIMGSSSLLVRLYGVPGGMPGGNFSFTICGMSLGGRWYTPYTHYAAELASMPDMAATHRFLYAKAYENIREKPAVFFKSMAQRGKLFLRGIGKHTVGGYVGFPLPQKLFFPGMLVLFLGYSWWLFGRRQQGEILFYCVTGLGIFFSALFIIADDGWRVIAASYPLLWLFLATGLSTPSRSWAVPPAKFAALPALIGLCFTFGATVTGPFAGKVTTSSAVYARHIPTPGFVGDLGLCGGLTVMPDDAQLPYNIPALRESTFLRLVAENYWHWGADLAASMRRELHPPYTVYACAQRSGSNPEIIRNVIAEGIATPPGTGRVFSYSDSWYVRPDISFGRLLDEKATAP